MVLKTVLLDFEIPENTARYEVQISLEKTKNIFSRLPYHMCHMCELIRGPGIM